MPIRDHFHPPAGNALPWPSLHSGWIAELAGRLNEVLPPQYLALDGLRLGGGLEVDIAAAEREEPGGGAGRNGAGAAVATPPAVYAPPAATGTADLDVPDLAEVRVFRDRSGRHLVGAIELVSPGNKDRGEKREAFVAKCLDYLASGMSLVIVDVVTERHANLHNELAGRLGAPALGIAGEATLYAVSYRPATRGERTEVDVWTNPFAVGDVLPTMPLRLVRDLFVPVELEATYVEACRRRRFVP